MKRNLLIIFLFFILFSALKVNALERRFASSEYLDDIFYYKYDGKIYHFKYGKVIRDIESNEVAYCIQPFDDLVDNTAYKESISYNESFGISEENWEKIKLLSYYGYGYENHTDKKWISITQMVIWRTLYPSLKFEWINNLSDRTVINPYNKEINELNELVENHYTLPNFIDENEEIILGLDEIVFVHDRNNVLKNYKIVKSDFNSSIEEDHLRIGPENKEKEGIIVLERASSKYSQNVMYFYHSSSQNVIKTGNIEPVRYTLHVRVKGGTITITKVDKETKETKAQGNACLDGTVYNLFDDNDNFIDEKFIENGTLTFDNLRFGKYYIVEKYAGIGYLVDDEKHFVEINMDNFDENITLEDQVIKSKIKIIKKYGTKEEYENNEMKNEQGISFEIYDDFNEMIKTVTTDENGEINLILPYGNYLLKQITTTEGYEKDEDKIIEVDGSNEYIEMILNDLKIEEPPKEEPPKEEPPKEEPPKEEPPVPIKVEVPNASFTFIRLIARLIWSILHV
ncbi:MAG: Cys-Gln thioester bond-forming surface protein [Bacilli bacterium]|nr:Cys-Gln thioester bond-forming surface protein [Bacilli bacterium]